MNNNRCVVCGAVIPEGRQVCPICDKLAGTWREAYDIGIRHWSVFFHRRRLEALRPLLVGLLGVHYGMKCKEFIFDSKAHYKNALAVLEPEFSLYTMKDDRPILIPAEYFCDRQ